MAIDGNGIDGYGGSGFTQEEIEDFVGDMVTGNTETGITVTYQDADGTLDFVTDDLTFAGDSGSTALSLGDTVTIAGGTNVTTSMSGDTLTINASAAGISDVVDDTSPQLGGDLDVNGHSIVSTSNGDINITPNGTGNVALGNFTFNADQTVGAGEDNYALVYDNASGLINLESVAGGGGGDAWSDPVDANIVPDVDSTRNIGTAGNRFQTIYTDSLSAAGEIEIATGNLVFNTISGSDILDGAGNELLRLSTAPSAVNYPELSASATGNAVELNALGDDTNIDIDLQPKGTGNTILGNYTLDGDQSVGAGQDNYVLTYDNSSGLISLEAAAGGSGDAWGDPVDADIVPDSDSVRDLGSTSNYFAEAYIDAITTTGNITVGGTVDGRDVAADGTKLDGIEASADVTDEANVTAALDGATLTAVTVATGDKILAQDVSDADNLKTVTAQSIADLYSPADLSIAGDTGSGALSLGDTLTVTGFPSSGISSFYLSDTMYIDAADDTLHGDTGSITKALGLNVYFLGGTSISTSASGSTITFNVDDDFLSNTGDVGTGSYDFGGASDFEIPNGTAPSLTKAGQIAVDTSIANHTGLIQYHDGVESLYAVGLPTGNLTSTDKHAIVYNGGNREFEMSDSFLLNTGDTGTGVYDFGGATSLEIPNGAAPTVNAAGEIAVDTTITDYTGMIKYHDGTEELTVLAVPTANLSTTDGEVVAYNATNNELEFVTAGGGTQDWELISTATASSDATVTFTDLSSTYGIYKLFITNCAPATNNVAFYMRTSANNGTSYDSGSSDYDGTITAVVGGAYSDNEFQNTPGAKTNISLLSTSNTYKAGSSTNEQINGEIIIYNPSSANFTHVSGQFSWEEENGQAARSIFSGYRASAAAVDAIEIRFESGNISVGNFYLFGLRSS